MSPGEIIYIVDDEQGMRKALTRLLTLENFDARAYASGDEFLAAFNREATSCLILDVEMPGTNGLELQKRLSLEGITLPIIFLTGRGDISMSVRAMKGGAVDFLTKPVDDLDLLRAVRSSLDLAARRRLEESSLKALRTRYAALTPREKEVMAHVVAGELNKQIAGSLGTGEQTIKVHRARVMEKMGVVTLADLVRAAERLNPSQ